MQRRVFLKWIWIDSWSSMFNFYISIHELKIDLLFLELERSSDLAESLQIENKLSYFPSL
jgi:hypothetical protein